MLQIYKIKIRVFKIYLCSKIKILLENEEIK
jgi:hypothetical protein